MKTIATASLLLLLSLRALGATPPNPLETLTISLDYDIRANNVQGPNERTGGTVVAQYRASVQIFGGQNAWCELEREIRRPRGDSQMPLLKAAMFPGPRKARIFRHEGNSYADVRLDHANILRCYTPEPIRSPYAYMKIIERAIPGLRFLDPSINPGDK